jgi:N-acetylglucosamine-6-phosphate deacetylase
MDEAVRNLQAFAGVGQAAACRAASTAPAAVLPPGGPDGGQASRGVVAPGARADLTLLDATGHVVATIVAGERAYERAP